MNETALAGITPDLTSNVFTPPTTEVIASSDSLVTGYLEWQWSTISSATGADVTPQQLRARALLGAGEPLTLENSPSYEWNNAPAVNARRALPARETSGTRAEQAPTPTLAIVVANDSEDKISYLLQAIMHGAAIGANVRVYAGSNVRENPQVVALLNKIGMSPANLFAGGEALGDYHAELTALRLQELTHDIEDYPRQLEALAARHARISREISALQSPPRVSLQRLENMQSRIDALRANIQTLEAIRARKEELLFHEDVKIAELVRTVDDDENIHGILTLLPGHTRDGEFYIRAALRNSEKDLDGSNPANNILPITPDAAIELAEHYVGPLKDIAKGQIAIFGFGKLVGEPLTRELIKRGIMPGLLLEKREDIENWREIVAAKMFRVIFGCARMGKFVDAEGLTPAPEGLVFIDAGNVKIWDATEQTYKTFGNFDTTNLDAGANIKVTPIYRGLGPVTVAKLFDRLIAATPKLNEQHAAVKKPKPRVIAAVGALLQRLTRLQRPSFALKLT